MVTMSWRSLADAVIGAAPAGSFAASITGDEVTNGKPDPEPYLAAAAALGVDPSACLAIEDSPTGVASALAAGCVTLGVPHVVSITCRPPGSPSSIHSTASTSMPSDEFTPPDHV